MADNGQSGALAVPVDKSIESLVGKTAVANLREDLGIVHPNLKGVLFDPADFAVLYGLRKTLEELRAYMNSDKYYSSLTKRLEEVAKLRQRKGILAKLLGKNKRLYLSPFKLTKKSLTKLSEQAYRDVFSEQMRQFDEIKEVLEEGRNYLNPDHTSTIHYGLKKGLEGLIEETKGFVESFTISTPSESDSEVLWKAVTPVMEKFSFLSLKSETVSPFKSSGKISSKIDSQNTTLYTLLNQPYGSLLVDELLMSFKKFNDDLKQLTARFGPFAKKGEEPPPNLLRNLGYLNYFIGGLYTQNGGILSGSYASGINTWLSRIKENLEKIPYHGGGIFQFFGEYENGRVSYGGHWGDHVTTIRYSIEEHTGFNLKVHKLIPFHPFYTATKPCK
ncbi:hypothetical protein KY347_05815 [Candidatus Woesearchaeota archaeon]|nr:hypothetical protein [Candidatus Woesearchaeota archaeon]